MQPPELPSSVSVSEEERGKWETKWQDRGRKCLPSPSGPSARSPHVQQLKERLSRPGEMPGGSGLEELGLDDAGEDKPAGRRGRMASSKRPLPDQPGALTSGAVSILPSRPLPSRYRSCRSTARRRDEEIRREQAEGAGDRCRAHRAEAVGPRARLPHSRSCWTGQATATWRLGPCLRRASRPCAAAGIHLLRLFEAYSWTPARTGHHKREQEGAPAQPG